MISKKLAQKMAVLNQAQSQTSFNLNFKIEGDLADVYDKVSQKMNFSRTQLAKFIIENSVEDMLIRLEQEAVDKPTSQPELTEDEIFEQRIIKAVTGQIKHRTVGDTFELKDLLDDEWGKLITFMSKNVAGRRFKALVKQGVFQHIEFVKVKTNNHSLYKKIG
jgi:uncharacterized protein YfkK (UPF0435 family)